VQHWFNLADEACEEALLDNTALRRLVGIDLGRERVPDGHHAAEVSALAAGQ
jgi:IS5 family transposase